MRLLQAVCKQNTNYFCQLNLFGNDAKNSWWFFLDIVLFLGSKFEEEVGSAEEQPASNKIYLLEWPPYLGGFLFIILVAYG